jgi:hypothetical protein
MKFLLPMRTRSFYVCYGMLACSPAGAAIVMDFEGIDGSGLTRVQEFYNGGTDEAGNAGPNFGVSFNPEYNYVRSDGETPAFLGNVPSGHNALSWVINGQSVAANVAAGFSDNLSFYFAANQANGSTISIYDDLDGTGTLLGSLVTHNNQTSGCAQMFCDWTWTTIAFSGTAKSIAINGGHANLYVDDLTLGAVTTPVPLPAALPLFAVGLAAFGGFARRKRRASPSVV